MADTYEINDKSSDENITLEEQAANLPEDAPEGARPDWLPEKFKSPEDLAEAYNFSGRCCNRKIDAEEICNEWISKYNEAASFAKEITASRQHRYTLQPTFPR